MAQVESAPAPTLLDRHVKDDKGWYMTLLVDVSLLLVSNDFPLEVQSHGAKMIKHLLKFRREDLSTADLVNLNIVLVEFPDEDHTLSKEAKSKDKEKHTSSLLALAANNSFRSLAAEGTVDSHVPLELGTKSEYVNAQMRLRYNSQELCESSHSSSTSSGTRLVGTQSETSNVCNNDNSKSITDQVDYDEGELEFQRLMSIDIFDNNEVNCDLDDQVDPKHHDEFGNRITVLENVADIVHPQMLGLDGKAYSHQVKACLLFAEHNILCQGFVMITRLRNTKYEGVIPWLLNALNTIWTQPDWLSTYLCDGFGLSCLFSDGDFLKMVYNVVKFYEDELERCVEGRFTEMQSTSYVFLYLFLPLLLQLLGCIHALWKGQIACNLSVQLEKAKTVWNGEEDSQQDETMKLLEQIRDSGYKTIGLSMSIEGAFDDLLNCSHLSFAFADLGSMEFRHLSKLIHHVFLPLIKCCPFKYWKEGMLNLLGPLIRHCEDVLYYAWFSLLHEGRARVPYYIGKVSGSEENIENLELAILLQFTRDVSHIFESVSSPELNSSLPLGYFKDANDKKMTIQDMGSSPSNSLIEYLLVSGSYGRLRMSLFGYWMDDEATKKTIPFCRALIQLAGIRRDKRLDLFLLDELLPCIVKHLDDQLPSAIRYLSWKLNSIKSNSVNEDLVLLCQELYNYLYSFAYSQNMDLVVKYEDCIFWLEKQKKDLRMKACCSAPDEFKDWEIKWNWEFEDEFRRYLPIYIDMLKEVDAMEETLEHDYLDRDVLLRKLNSEFKLKYAIHSREHPHLIAISYMRRRKFTSTTQVRNHKRMCEIVSKLITLTPYIKFLFDSVLYLWEPQFHPLIREPLTPNLEDFPPHLKPYAMLYIATRLKTSVYAMAEAQIHMHEEYDHYLGSGKLDGYIYGSMSLEEKDIDSWAVPKQFLELDRDLIKLSLKRRATIVQLDHQVRTYLSLLRSLLEDDLLKERLTNLLNELEVCGFFDINNGGIHWEKRCFTELIDKVSSEVFAQHSLPRHYVIRGIIDYRTIALYRDKSWQSFEQVVGEACNRLTAYLPQFWRDTRHYKHRIYDIVREPLEKVFM